MPIIDQVLTIQRFHEVGHQRKRDLSTIKRVIFLCESPPDARKYKYFGIELLEKNGFQVEVWDLTRILHPEFLKKYVPPHQFGYKMLRAFEAKAAAYEQLQKLSRNDFVVNCISYYFWNLGVYRALSRSQAHYAVSFANPVPIFKKVRLHILKRALGNLIRFRRSDSKFFVLWKKFIMMLPPSWLGVKPARLVLTGGEKYYMFRYPVDKTTEVLKIHSFDYERYLEQKGEPCTVKPMAVFIDEFAPFHPDNIFDGKEQSMPAAKYYALLNRTFDYIEQRTGCKVVIAADPRSNYEDLPDYFNGRPWFRGKTIDLVRESQFVLAHRSTAVSFVNLYYKPVIFLTCEYFDKRFDGKQVKEMARWFGKKPVFLEEPEKIDFGKELIVEKNCYDRYRAAFLKAHDSISKDHPFWQVVADRFKRGL